ncbi:hypothetical protein TrCOL_g2674, partial [Triparma columacea]
MMREEADREVAEQKLRQVLAQTKAESLIQMAVAGRFGAMEGEELREETRTAEARKADARVEVVKKEMEMNSKKGVGEELEMTRSDVEEARLEFERREREWEEVKGREMSISLEEMDGRMREIEIESGLKVEEAKREAEERHKGELKVALDAMELQRTWRGYREWNQFGEMLGAAIVLQGLVRGKIAREAFKSVLGATILLQSWGRMLLGKKTFRIQMFVAKRRFEKAVAGATKIQKIIRGVIALKSFNEKLCATMVVQSFGRMVIGKKTFKRAAIAAKQLQEKKEVAAVHFQSAFRGFVDKKQFKRVKAVVVFQALFRGHVARQDIALANFAATQIQKMWRGAQHHMNFITM